MSIRLVFSILFLVIITACGKPETSPKKLPNIVVIFTDDHGYSDLGIMGIKDDVRTPHIDALARRGVLMTQGYVSAPTCVPSRAGLLTGRYQNTFGLDTNIEFRDPVVRNNS